MWLVQPLLRLSRRPPLLQHTSAIPAAITAREEEVQSFFEDVVWTRPRCYDDPARVVAREVELYLDKRISELARWVGFPPMAGQDTTTNAPPQPTGADEDVAES